ncbi:MAG: tetratricopeptide repeat protein [Planctomycetota bacterium]|jgi:tetratricopeptide (TPR) repeat protein
MERDINIVFAPLILKEGLEAEKAPQFARIMPRLLAAVFSVYERVRSSSPIMIVAVTEDDSPGKVVKRSFLGFSGEDDAERLEGMVQENEPDADYIFFGVLSAFEPIRIEWKLQNVVAGFTAGKGTWSAVRKSLPNDLVKLAYEIAGIMDVEGPSTPEPALVFGSSDPDVLQHLIEGLDAVAAAESGIEEEVTQDIFKPFLNILKIAPASTPAVHELAKLCLNILAIPNGKPDWKNRAMDALEMAAKIAPENDYLHFMLGEAYLRLDRNEDVIETWKRVIELQPKLGIYHYRLGLLLEEMGREAEALEIFERGVKEADPYHDLLDKLGVIRANEGDFAAAEALWRSALKAVPESPTCFGHLARLEMERGNTGATALLLEEGIKTPEHFWAIYLHLAEFFGHDKPRAMALMDLVKEQLSRFENNGEALFAIGTCFQAANDNAMARELFEKAVKLSPDSESGIAAIRRLLQMAIPDFEPQFRKACEEVIKGSPEEAVDFLTKTVETNADFWPAWYFLGVAKRSEGNENRALEAFNNVIRLNPGNLDAVNEIAVIHSFLGEHKKAEENYRKALGISPGNAEIMANLAYCLFEQGQKEEAKAEILRALEMEPGNNHVTETAKRIGIRKRKRGFWRRLLGGSD